MKNPNLQNILERLKPYFRSLYQDQLEAIVLYGSQARGDAHPFSDIDILVILKNKVDFSQEIRRTSHFISQVCLDYEVVISRHFMSSEKFINAINPLMQNVRKEGIIL